MPTTLLESQVRPPARHCAAPSEAPPNGGMERLPLPSRLPLFLRPTVRSHNRKPAGKSESGECRSQGHSLRGRVELRAPATGRGGERVLSGAVVSLVLCRSARLTVSLSNQSGGV